MTNYNTQSPRSLNANAQAFIPSPAPAPVTVTITPSKPPPTTCAEATCFAKSILETIPESPSLAPLKSRKLFTPTATRNHTHIHHNNPPFTAPGTPFSMPLPPFYNDRLALIPAMDQNGLFVMIPPSLATPGSMFTPIMNISQPTPQTPQCVDDNNDSIYKHMEIDSSDIEDTYQTIQEKAHRIQQKYIHEKNIKSFPKQKSKKYSSTFLLRIRKILTDQKATNNHNHKDILNSIPKDLQFLTTQQKPFENHSKQNSQRHTHTFESFESFANLNLTNPNLLSHLTMGSMPLNLIAQPQPIADMQSLLFMNNYAPMPPQPPQLPQPFPMSFALNTMNPLSPMNTNIQLHSHNKSQSQPQLLDSKVVYLVEDGNKSNHGFAQYSRTPTPQTSPNPKRFKQSLTGMKFERKRNKQVHECFKDNPDLFALGGYDSIMNKIAYQIPNNNNQNNNIMNCMDNETEEAQATKLFSGILNKLTPENNKRLITVALNKLRVTCLNTLHVIAQTFHSKIIVQKPLARLYCNFLLALKLEVGNQSLVGIILRLIWKQIDNQYKIHETFCARRSTIEQYLQVNKNNNQNNDEEIYYDLNDLNELTEQYNNWLERLYGNYVLLIELFCNNKAVFKYNRLHEILLDLIVSNKEWTWNIVYIILIYHGVALQKLVTAELEQYLESIDELIDGIHYKQSNNNKYQHIPLRIKYLLMDVQEHIETKNANIGHPRGFMNPQRLEEIHAEFCKENNMTQQQLRKLLSLSKIESSNKNKNKNKNNKNNKNNNNNNVKHTNINNNNHNNNINVCYNNYTRRFAPQQSEYPFHTPPRFQRMREQQRIEKQQKQHQQQQQLLQKQHKHKQKQHKQHRTKKHANKMQQMQAAQPIQQLQFVHSNKTAKHNKIMRKHVPLYLRNSSIPAPPNKCPPPPPGPPGPFYISQTINRNNNHDNKPMQKVHAHNTHTHHTPTHNTHTHNTHTHAAKKKKVVEKKVKKVENRNNGWSTVKRSNNKCNNVSGLINNNNNNSNSNSNHNNNNNVKKVYNKQNMRTQTKKHSNYNHFINNKKADIPCIGSNTNIKSQSNYSNEMRKMNKAKMQQKAVSKTVPKTVSETVSETRSETSGEIVNNNNNAKNKKSKNKKNKKKKKKKKKPREKKKKKKAHNSGEKLQEQNDECDEYDELDELDEYESDSKKNENEHEEYDCKYDYTDSDDEIWYESTQSTDSQDIDASSTFLFGEDENIETDTQTQQLEDLELETALFCEYFDEDNNDMFDVDGYTEDIDIFNINNSKMTSTNIPQQTDQTEHEIIDIICGYLETGNEDKAFVFLNRYKNENENDKYIKDKFVSVCIKLYVDYGLLDNIKSQHDISEIERLFVRQMFYNNTLNKNNYIASLKLINFDKILKLKPTALYPLSKILVILIENRILTLSEIANTLINNKCIKSYDISYQITKHLIHSTQAYVHKLKSLINQVKLIKFKNNKFIDLKSIFNELQIFVDYSLLN